MPFQRLFFVAGLLCVLAACQGVQRQTTDAAGETMPSGAVMRHMHLHAAQLDQLNTALRAGDLEAAGTPAYWLAKHETMPGIPKDWRPFIKQMRTEAKTVDAATDLATARAAAGRLAGSCRACHEANGRDIRLPR